MFDGRRSLRAKIVLVRYWPVYSPNIVQYLIVSEISIAIIMKMDIFDIDFMLYDP